MALLLLLRPTEAAAGAKACAVDAAVAAKQVAK